MKLVKRIYFILLLMLLCVFLRCGVNSTHSSVNLNHLDALCEDVTLFKQNCTIVHIYADAPSYKWTDSGEEGIACVDDVARAAVVYMKASDHLTKNRIKRIKGLLNFIRVMQAEDGEFYNFIQADLSINKTGKTSRKDFAFWAARGYWALGEGYAYFKQQDPVYADTLKTAFLKCLNPIGSILSHYGQYENKNDKSYPKWLMIQYGSDATSELLLGIAAFLRIEKHTQLTGYTRKLGEGIIAMQLQDHPTMSGAFESWPGYWHAWGNSQVQALAELSEVLGDDKLRDAVIKSADQFLSRLAAGPIFSNMALKENIRNDFPQIAYDIRTTSVGLLELYRLTGDRKYAILAGLSASWLYGNNVKQGTMYDPETGRVYDGIDEKGINRNSGAESTIEGLFTLIEIEKEPLAAKWLQAIPQQTPNSFFSQDASIIINKFTNQTNRVIVKWDNSTGNVELMVSAL